MAKDMRSYVPVLRRELRKNKPSRILEWGPGHSTSIMHEECPHAEIQTIEHLEKYAKKARNKHGYAYVHHIKIPENKKTKYASTPWEEGWGPFDLIFVDGRRRVECLLAARRVVAPDGVVILHDSDREYYNLGTELFDVTYDYGHTKVMQLMTRGIYDEGRAVATVADAKIEDEVNRWSKSLRMHGWKGPIIVYAPASNPPDVPDDCDLRLVEEWWKDYELDVPNASAVIKPSIFCDPKFRDQDLVLYTDSADLIVLCDVNDIFDTLGQASLSSVTYPNARVEQFLPDHIIEQFDLDTSEEVMRARHVNSGVILARISPAIRSAMAQWKTILQTALQDGPLLKSKGKVGDQAVYSYLYRLLQKQGKAKMLPKTYNYRGGGKEVKELKVKDGRVIDPDGEEVFVPHATGQYSLPDRIVDILE